MTVQARWCRARWDIPIGVWVYLHTDGKSRLLVLSCEGSVVLFAPCCHIKRVTDEALGAETEVWPIPFLIICSLLLKDLF